MKKSSKKLPAAQATPPSIAELLNRAALHIISGENHLRQAAEDIAAAAAQGASQRKIAMNVKRSVGWVNALLAWRAGGYQETPFGPAAAASRERAAVQSTEHQPVKWVKGPITIKTEREYTDLIKNRQLYEGACTLYWPRYFEYRDAHPDECAELTDDDLAYVSQWTHARPAPIEARAEISSSPVTPSPDVVRLSFDAEGKLQVLDDPVLDDEPGDPVLDDDDDSDDEHSRPWDFLLDMTADDPRWTEIVTDLGSKELVRIIGMLQDVLAKHYPDKPDSSDKSAVEIAAEASLAKNWLN